MRRLSDILALILAAGAATGALPARESPETLGERVLAEHAESLGLDASRLAWQETRTVGTLRHLRYQQFHAGFPVEGAIVTLTLGPGGALIALVSRAVPAIDLDPGGPRLSREEARACALRDSGAGNARGIVWWEERLAVCPRRLSGRDRDRWVWCLGLRAADPPGAWRMLVDARSGEILLRRSLVHSAGGPAADETRFRGETRGRIRTPTPYGDALTVPFPDLAITALDGEAVLASGYSDSLGRFDLGPAPAATPQVRAELAGRYASVHRGRLEAAPRVLTLEAGAAPVDVLWDSTRATPAELEVYVHLAQARARLRTGGITLPALDRPVPLVVSDSSLVCNALTYTVPDAPWIRFAAAGGGCSEMGRLADVVAHEYAHLIALYAYQPDWAPDSLLEGFADFFAASLADTSRVGRDWRGPGTWLRDLAHERRYPVSPDCATSDYCIGALVGGALWDMRASLIASSADRTSAIALAERLFLRMLLARPDDFQTCVLYLLLQDDDDGDPGNGTPHLDAIAGAFERHGLGDFGVQLSHVPLADTDPQEGVRAVTVTTGSVYPIDPEGARLHYRIDDGPFQVATLTAEGRDLRGALPGGPADVTVRYYLTAVDRAGHAASLPAGAPTECFAYRIGSDVTPPSIRHLAPPALAPGPPGFWVAARVADERGDLRSALVDASLERDGSISESTWVLVPKAPDDPAHAGLLEAFAGLGELRAGDRLRYRLRAYDDPPASNRRDFPTEGEITIPVFRGAMWDFETEPSDFVLSGDWAWRPLPRESLGGAERIPSGARCAGLVPASRATSAQSLRLPPIDLAGWSGARLEGLLHFRAPGLHAGGRVEVSANGGEHWSAVTPVGGYPGEAWIDSNGDGFYDSIVPAWTDSSASWERFVVPLDVPSGPVLVRFVVWTDPDSGPQVWYLDDLGLLEAPARGAPRSPAASQGMDERVGLSWLAPHDSGPDLLGYRVYRGGRPGDYSPQPLVPGPISATAWVDDAVTNGEQYHYAVAALWPDGEGPRSDDAAGCPYRPVWNGPEGVVAITGSDETGSDTLWIANHGTGTLRLGFLLADEGETLTDRRLLGTVPAPSLGFTRLATDPRDAVAPDLRSLAYRTVSGNLVFRVGTHGPLPDPRTAFTLRLFLDTDLSPATGLPENGLGAEFVVVLGRWIHDQTEGAALGYVLNERLEYVVPPSFLFLHEGFDSLEVAVPLGAIGDPTRFACAVLAEADRLPDAPRVSWLSFSPRGGAAEPDAPFPLALAYDLRGAAGLEHRAQILVETNDVSDPVPAIAITVRRGPPEVIGALRLDPPYPNPARSGATLRLLVPQGVAWSADILDVTGRRVRHLAQEPAGAPGLRVLRWDGRRDDATRAESGVYYIWVRGGGARTARTILVVR